MTMARFRSKPSEIEAVQWTGDNADEVYRFVQRAELALDRVVFRCSADFGELLAGANGSQGWVPVPLGHWIVRQPGVFTDHWPVEDDYFQRKYERIEDG